MPPESLGVNTASVPIRLMRSVQKTTLREIYPSFSMRLISGTGSGTTEHMPDQNRRRRLRSPLSRAPLNRDALLALDARIKPDFKRAVALGLLAVIALAVGDNLGGIERNGKVKVVVIVLTVLFAAFGFTATRSAARETFRINEARNGPATASALRLVVSVTGYGLVLLGLLQLLKP